MHPEVMDFLESVKAKRPELFRATSVLECGSRIVNGSPRELFEEPAEYIGLDWQPGDGVDVVSLAHEYDGRPDGHFDVVISTEMLEHDPHWRHSIKRMVELLKPGGTLIVTCAGPGRAAHDMDSAPDSGHYRSITAEELRGHLRECGEFGHLRVESRQEWPCDT